jgi:hypothetical protein
MSRSNSQAESHLYPVDRVLLYDVLDVHSPPFISSLLWPLVEMSAVARLSIDYVESEGYRIPSLRSCAVLVTCRVWNPIDRNEREQGNGFVRDSSVSRR